MSGYNEYKIRTTEDGYRVGPTMHQAVQYVDLPT